jgi:hypothetical protein
MTATGGTTRDKLKVFVSYCRRDIDFADQLVAVLKAQGFRIAIDREGIYGAERWEERLGQLILESDVVVFVLSPDSARSDICAWEVEEALRRGKRIIPVLCRSLEGAQPHVRLRDLNYIYHLSLCRADCAGLGLGHRTGAPHRGAVGRHRMGSRPYAAGGAGGPLGRQRPPHRCTSAWF